GQDLRIGRNIVDRFLRVDFRTLAPGLWEGVYQVAFQFEKACLKNGEKPGGPCPDNYDVCFYHGLDFPFKPLSTISYSLSRIHFGAPEGGPCGGPPPR